MNSNNRIKLEDSVYSALYKLTEGNIGALNVVMAIIEKGNEIDPYTEPFMIVLLLDTFGIYGCRIWMLFKDVCKQKLDVTIAMIRATQMGVILREVLDHAIDNGGEGLDVADTCRRLKEQLPNFKFEETKI